MQTIIVVDRASYNLKYNANLNPEAQRAALNEARVRAALQNGEVIAFSFYKKNGVLRKCIATTNLNRIPNSHHPTSGFCAYTAEQIRFFDFTVGEWRSCLADQIKEIFV